MGDVPLYCRGGRFVMGEVPLYVRSVRKGHVVRQSVQGYLAHKRARAPGTLSPIVLASRQPYRT